MSQTALQDAAPAWAGRLTEDGLRERLGFGTYERGRAYARDGAVLTVNVGDRGRLLLATVRGSGRSTYQTLVAAETGSDAAVRWSSRCSCPMQVDCKHVAALLVTTRSRLVQMQVPAVPSWEAQLADLVRPDAPEVTAAALGLQLETVTHRPTRYGSAADPAQRIRITPVTMGKANRWIKTGVSWRELEAGSGALPVPAQHRELAVLIASRFRASQPPWISPYSQPQVYLDDLGAGGWRLLREALECGVALVAAGQAGRVVHLADSPASVVIDLRQAHSDAPAQLRVAVRVPDVGDLAPSEVNLVGSPPVGLFVEAADRLLLAPFEQSLDAGVSALLRRDDPISIPAPDVPRFLGRYYPALRQRVTLESGDGTVSLPEILPPRLSLRVRFAAGHQTDVHWGFAYTSGDQSVRVPIGGNDTDVVRDAAAEAALLERLSVLDAVPGLREGVGMRRRLVPDVRLSGLGTAAFVEQVLPDLLARDDIEVQVEGTPAEYAETDEAPLIVVSATDSRDPDHVDWFDLGVAVSIAGQEVPLAPLLTALAHGDDELILDSGTWFRLDRPELHALRHLIDEARALEDRPSESMRLTPWQAGLWDELVSLGVVEHQSERWRRTAGALLSMDSVPHPEPPVSLRAQLRPYQLDGYQWLCLLWDHGLGGVLADDMGLGKTLQTLAMATRAYEQGSLAQPLLIVAPTSVVATWASEAARFCPQLRVVTVTETQHRGRRPLAELTAGAHLVVTSYALLRIDDEAYRALPWSGLVLDEAQFVKNHQAKTYQCARRLPAPFKLAITGTPLENSLMDLWSLFSIAAPGLFPNPQRFTDAYRRPIEGGHAPERLATLRRRIRPLMLRRTKEQVAPELPPKIEQILEITLNAQHRRIYDKHLQRERQRVLGLIDDLARNRIAIFRSLTLLRQLALDASLVDAAHAGTIRSSKIDALMEQLTEVVAEGHRVLVFSQFTGFLALVRERLAAEGIAHCYLDGRTRDRPRRIAQFRDGDAPVFLISLKAGGVGLTLTEADYVFVLDPWWNPATEAQAIDRTHRIGQDKTVMVYRLVATGTIEEKVVQLQQRKKDLFNQVVDDDALLAAPLSADDIRGLFAD